MRIWAQSINFMSKYNNFIVCHDDIFFRKISEFLHQFKTENNNIPHHHFKKKYKWALRVFQAETWLTVYRLCRVWLTPSNPLHQNVLEKNYLSQIECWNLENEAKTTRKIINLSVNFVVPTSCQLSPYYSLSLSRISSTSHGK